MGGRALGSGQVAFRAWLDAQDEDETWMSSGDVEARLMESLGWLLLEHDVEPAPGTATSFAAGDLDDLVARITPAVAEANDLPEDELLEEVETAWTSYLRYLDESGTWSGSEDELADCLDAVAGTPSGPPNVVSALLARLAADLDPVEEFAHLRTVPAAAGIDGLSEARDAVAGQIALRLDEADAPRSVQAAVLTALLTPLLSTPSTRAEAVAPVADHPEDAETVLGLLETLREDGVVEGSDPWTTAPAMAGALLLVFEAFVEPGTAPED
ncbi:hypothetical protein ACFFKU_00620 [Kineococcus gynurae]|uniref:Uncharacterized protein n=1 Tax=Kineococcus gynurae TaxID=452979 RepID=A0ABV5LPM8_9ACTN